MGRSSTTGERDDPLAALYERTVTGVLRVLRRWGITSPADLCDLAQDAYLVAGAKLATRDPAAPEAAWMGTIARNLALKHHRGARIRAEGPLDSANFSDCAASASTTEDLVAQRRHYLALVEGLDEGRREVFEMFEVEGFTLEEIAAALDIPVGTAHRRLALAHEDISAATARLKAREAWDVRRRLPLLLPFGVGAWRGMAGLFDDGAEDVAEEVWRGVQRGLDRAALVGSAARSTASATALVSTGAAVGVAGTLAVLVALHLLDAKPPPVTAETSIVPALVAMAAPAPKPEPAAGGTPVAAGPATAAVAADRIEDEEVRLLREAGAAWRRQDPEGARRALDEHERRFPQGKLAPARKRLRAELAGASAAAPPGVLDPAR